MLRKSSFNLCALMAGVETVKQTDHRANAGVCVCVRAYVIKLLWKLARADRLYL